MNDREPSAAGVPPDEPDAVVGVEELVEAILHPHYDGEADWVYWKRFVDLTCVLFGLEGRTRWLQMAMEQISSAVLPMEGSMEVPKEVGAAYRAIDNYNDRYLAVRVQLRQLQREFFLGLLLAIDPSVRHRETTVGCLRELGLPERRRFDWDDY